MSDSPIPLSSREIVGGVPDSVCFRKLPSNPSACHQWQSAGDALAFLRLLGSNGGPSVEQHGLVTSCFLRLRKDNVPFNEVREALRPTISTPDCIQGFAFLKPHGYSGDFEIIDRIYTFWKSQDPKLNSWDEYFHLQPAPRAVRNRKWYFHQLLRQAESAAHHDGELHVLNVASGPGRDVYEYLPDSRRVMFDCVDVDKNAIDFAGALCGLYAAQVTFRRSNVLRLRLHRQYDLIWCAGLLDYFDDRLFVRTLRQLIPHVTPTGQLVIGNFSDSNPSRYWMEAVADWRLYHRSEDRLIALGRDAGIDIHKMQIAAEPEKVILFLHVAG